MHVCNSYSYWNESYEMLVYFPTTLQVIYSVIVYARQKTYNKKHTIILHGLSKSMYFLFHIYSL